MSEHTRDFLRSLLDPERLGWAVTQEVRDEARELLRRFDHVGRQAQGEQPGSERGGVGEEARCPLLHQAPGGGEQVTTGQDVFVGWRQTVPDRVQEAGGEADEATGVHPC
jgi:hypothetical protein